MSSAQQGKGSALTVGVLIKGVKIIVRPMGESAIIAPSWDILQKYAGHAGVGRGDYGTA